MSALLELIALLLTWPLAAVIAAVIRLICWILERIESFRRAEDMIENYIRSYGNLKNLKSLTEIAKYLGYTKPTFTRKVREDSFTRKEAGRMFKKLEFRDEDIVKLMKE